MQHSDLMSSHSRSSSFLSTPVLGALLTLALSVVGACGGATPPGEAGGPGGAAGGPPPGLPVDTMVLAPSPVKDVSEFVGTVKSRRSTTVQPQVEGFLTRIAVTSGSRVTPGTLLFEIDSASQQALVASLESTKAVREADLAYARQQAARAKSLFEVGAASQQELDQTSAAVASSEAQLQAIESQIRQQNNELAYYRVTAPTAGVIGDIPVRQGDRVTRSTMLTTIEDNERLELYVRVPVQDASRLKPGLTVELLGPDGGVLATEKLGYVATSVDETQTVLAKATLSGNTSQFRADQFVPVRLIWSEAPGLLIPITAVTRVGGQFFVFVVSPGEGGGTVARMRPVEVGDISGNNYVVRSGLAEGDQVITGGTQKIGDGAPVTPMPSAPASGGGDAAQPGGEGR